MKEIYKEFLDTDLSINGTRDHDLTDRIYIICLFKDSETGTLFTVLKPETQENNIKYFGSVGKKFEVEVIE